MVSVTGDVSSALRGADEDVGIETNVCSCLAVCVFTSEMYCSAVIETELMRSRDDAVDVERCLNVIAAR